MFCRYLFFCVVSILANSSYGISFEENFVRLSHLTTCTYDYEVSVHTARGAQSTSSDGYQLHALVRDNSLTLTKNSR